tara:strand:+ start:1355 stop:1663 length:309 start_codon:yes stop_codon:yes gene_type:complete
MSTSLSYRAPSNPGMEKTNLHIPPKMKTCMLDSSSLNNYMQKFHLHSSDVYVSTSQDVFSNESKNDLERFYQGRVQSKWTDENNNLKVWDYEAKKQGLDDVF